MESDAFASFVAVDMELQEPLFEIGLIASTLYADVPDDPGSGALARPRHFRHSLEVLKRAVQSWNQCGARLAFVAHLGDALAAENAQADAQWSALHTFDEERGRCVSKAWHLVPGEADLRCFGATQLGAALMPCRKGEEAYYSFSPAKGWRVLVLDAYDVSLLANAPDSEAHAAALGLVQQQNPNTPDAPDPLAGLEGVARRWGYSGGGVGAVQLSWLGGQLDAAEAASERVIVLCHKGCLAGAVQPQGLLYNYEEVQACVDAHPGVVAAWVCGSEPLGSYARDGHGVHHLCPCAAAECDVNQDAYGVIQVFHESMKLRMAGRAPDAKLRPQGWPEDLAFPQGGKMVTAEGAEGAWGVGASLARLWLFMLYTLMAPVSPLLRLLASATSGDSEASGSDVPPAPPAAPAAPAVPPPRAAPPPVAEPVSSVEDQV